MKTSFLILFAIASGVIAQVPTFEATFDLQLGKNGAGYIFMGELEPIQSAVVFRRLPALSSCPGTQAGEYELKKVNPNQGRAAMTEYISVICTIIDSVVIDTVTFYEVPTSQGRTYYMRQVQLLGSSVKVRVSPDLPANVLRDTLTPFREPQDRNTILDFRKVRLDSASIMMVGLGSPNAHVVLKRLDGPAVCPTFDRWEFELRKVNPMPVRFPLSRRVSETCVKADSLDVDSNLVYELYTAEGETYFMRLLQWTNNLAGVRLTVAKPTVSLAPRALAGKHSHRRDGDAYRPDGKSISSEGKAKTKHPGPAPVIYR